MSTQIQFKRGTAASLQIVNPVLAAGELCYETDTKKFKIGDGTTAWNSLSYPENFDALDVTNNVAIGGNLSVTGSVTVDGDAVSTVPDAPTDGGKYARVNGEWRDLRNDLAVAGGGLPNPPGMARMVTIRNSGTFSVTVKTTTGYAAVRWWDGSVEVLGAGTAANDITVSKAIPTTGNWIKSAPKEIFVWSCTSGNANQSGDLTSLVCESNSLTSLDVSGLTALTTLNCDNNSLTSLDVSGLTAMTYLSCSSNSLTSLNVSSLTNLQNLGVGWNSLASLDVIHCTLLTFLQCNNNSLTSLDVSSLTVLTSLFCSYNSITSLDVSSLTALNNLDCSNNSLTSLDVSGLTVLNSLACYNNSLTSLRAVDVPGYAAFGTWATTYSAYRAQGVQAMNNLLDAAALNQLYADLADNTATGSYALAAVFGNPGIASDDPSIATAKNWIVLGT